MDCYFFIVVTIIIFFLMLFFPQTAICGASLGLMLWFQTVLPVLLPFLILTALLLKSNGFFLISRLVRPILRPLFGISDYGSFALLVGFLCGYPMGSKVTADLKREGKITVNEASYLLSFCNQTSPMFLISYIFYIHLKRPDLLFPGMLLIEGVPILMSIPFRKIYCPAVTSSASSPSPHFTWNMLDDCIHEVQDSGAFARDAARWPDSRHDGDYEGMESYLKTRIAWLDKTMKNMDEQIEK